MRGTQGESPDTRSRPGSRTITSEESGRVLACAFCLAPVTTAAARIQKHGAHQHDCVNPEGYRFRVGCFSRAAGCVAEGHPTTDHTWFPPYAWRVGLCANCGGHLGWQFTTADDRFFGLIVDHLVETPD